MTSQRGARFHALHRYNDRRNYEQADPYDVPAFVRTHKLSSKCLARECRFDCEATSRINQCIDRLECNSACRNFTLRSIRQPSRYGVRIDDQIAVGMVLEIPQSKCRLSNAIGSGDENDEWLCHDRFVRLPTQNVTRCAKRTHIFPCQATQPRSVHTQPRSVHT